ncbi:GNAT family N-acetyltransferase [Thiomicrorhabdus sp. ZW0627]|uniref:GNAT family N-acetyltransferase n=1 Tax=Thiomicrorhabdus sp. ZW0627 TaxID=3039774 RepID=UPI002436C025|nr:GNAT family N-acetyltransferase [Thiomicrorhabdus sp. ZW0627]MDG6774719.1 GNAT family N-acetyltransferase [Thiomicrorhabdus sp. ZW0627]
MLRLERLSGEVLLKHLPDLARLRIKVFREFPYLYEGEMAYEERYLQTYIKSKDSVVVLAWDGDQIVGASTGIPLSEETPNVQAPFVTASYPIDEIFYCGESVLLSEYRGQGAGVAFFEHREAHAKEYGYKYICFCAVQRSEDHPLRPADYVPLNQFWMNRGYQIQPQLQTEFSWKEIGEETESPKPMTFWMKELA